MKHNIYQRGVGLCFFTIACSPDPALLFGFALLDGLHDFCYFAICIDPRAIVYHPQGFHNDVKDACLVQPSDRSNGPGKQCMC